MEPTDLAQLVDDTLLLLEREMNKYRVKVEKTYQEVPLAVANGNQIQQVLLNLLINARQAMPSGGHVYIRLANDPASGMVDLAVRDTGCGIPGRQAAADLRPLLHHQVRTRRQRQRGHRPGAVVVPRHHRGAPRPDSRREHVGKGTAFTLKLPAVRELPPTALAIELPAAAPHEHASGR